MPEHIQTSESEVEVPGPPAEPIKPTEPTAPTTAPAAKPRSVWSASLLAGYWVWFTGIVACTLVTAVAWLPLEGLESKGGPAPATVPQLLQAWNRWDTVWYVIIADSGYEYDSRATAFFPLYPMLIRWLNPVLPGGTFEAALLVSVLASLATLVLVHRLAAEMLGPAHAQRTVFYLLAFPTGFYLFAAYNESLFIALSVASLYCMRRGLWWWAGLLAGFAGATRAAGVMLALAFAYEYLRQRGGWRHGWRGIRLDVLALGLVPSGLAVYMFYCYQTFGNALHFQESQKNWFRYGFTPPWTAVSDVIALIGRTEPFFGPTNIRNIINLSVALGVLVLLVAALFGPFRLGNDHTYLVLFAATIILIPLSNPLHSDYPLSGMWRYALECTVVFMLLARMGRDRFFDRAYLATALALQGAMIVTFVQNQFVA